MLNSTNETKLSEKLIFISTVLSGIFLVVGIFGNLKGDLFKMQVGVFFQPGTKKRIRTKHENLIVKI